MDTHYSRQTAREQKEGARTLSLTALIDKSPTLEAHSLSARFCKSTPSLFRVRKPADVSVHQ